MILPKIPLKSICQRFVTSTSIAYPSQKFAWANSEFRPTTNIFAFQDHNQNCLVCATLPKTSGWKRKCLSIAGPDRSKVDIKAVPQVDETSRKKCTSNCNPCLHSSRWCWRLFWDCNQWIIERATNLDIFVHWKENHFCSEIPASELKGKYQKKKKLSRELQHIPSRS